MFLRIVISLVLGLSYFASLAQYEIAGTVTNTSPKNAPLKNHPVYIFLDTIILDTTFTNEEGYYSYFIDKDRDGMLLVKTAGYCDVWQVYYDTVLRRTRELTIINFEICHENSQEACLSFFEYENVDSVTINFSPTHSLESLMNYDWSFGDDLNGSSDHNPQYQYAGQGIYTVQLVTTNPIGCIDTTISEVLVSEDTYIRGQLSIPDNQLSNAFVYLINVENNLIEKVIYPDQDGNYEMWCDPDNYLLKVVPDLDFDDYLPRVIPTYYGGTTDWKDAFAVTDKHEIKDIDIKALTSDFVPHGFNEIFVKLEADVNLNLLPVGVYLLDENYNPIDYGVKLDYGRYGFSNLPDGVYYVEPECPGRESRPYKVEFDYANMAPVYTEFVVSSTQINPLGINDIVRNDDRFKLYPVPISNTLNLNSQYPVKSVQIKDASGRLFSDKRFGMQNNLTLSTADWPKGIYFVTVFFDNYSPGCQVVVK